MAEADRAYAELTQLAPDRPDVHEAVGKHRLRQRDDAGALLAFTRALSLKPQNPALRELMRTVRPEEQYATSYLYDAVALAKTKPAANGDDVEVLADLTVTRVFANGLSSRTHQLVLRALTQRGVDQSRWQSVQYSPDRQVVRIERARIVRKDGTILETRSDGERNVSEPWYAMYYDLRSRVIGFPQLEPGDVLELVERTDDSGTNFFITVQDGTNTIFTDAGGHSTTVPKLDNDGVTGHYRSSEGLEGDSVWGTRGRWTMLSGVVQGEPVTLAILDHPKNVGFPTYWHARGYGLFAANPLGQKVFSEGRQTMNFTLEPGASATFRYRILIVDAKAPADRIEREFNAFAK